VINDSSQGSVTTYLRCGGKFSGHVTANLPPSLRVENFKTVHYEHGEWA